MSNQVDLAAASWRPISEAKPFQYSEIAPELAGKLQASASRVRERHRQHLDSIVETGRELIAAKEALPHGMFGAWLVAEFGWDERTARNYMAVASQFGGITETVSDLPMTTLYALASPTVPSTARETVLTQLKAGEKIAPLEVRRIVQEAKDAEAETRKQDRLTPEEKQAAATKAKSKRDRQERERQKWATEHQRQRDASEKAAAEAAHIICDSLGDNASHLERLLLTNDVSMSVLCAKLRERTGFGKRV